MTTLKSSIVILVLAIICAPLYADRGLDGKKAQKREVRQSMLGFRNTLLFYTFKDQQAILTLSIGNKDQTFPVTGKVYLFDDVTTEEGLKKWINNQHSDGLFPDIPKPVFTANLPKGSCAVTSHKQTGTDKNATGQATFKNYAVKLSIKAHAIDKKFKIFAFTDTARVHVKNIPAHAEKLKAAEPKAAPDLVSPGAPKGKKLLSEVRFPDAKSLRAFAFTDPSAWRWGFADDARYIEHFKMSDYKYPVRSPHNIALVKDQKFGNVAIDFEVMQTGRNYGHRDLCFFFGFQDPSHFYYVHIAAVSDPHAHNIMLVNGKPRVSISETSTKGHDWGKSSWHNIRIVRDIESGKIEVFANDMATPIMTATDKTFGAGWAGFGSFDDTGRVRAIRFYGEDKDMTAEKVPFFKKHGE